MSIPYDFDMAGIINTPYAEPDPRLGIRSVRERLFRGYCRTKEGFTAVFTQFNAQQETIYALYQNSPFLENKHKKRSIKYFDDFYKTINMSRTVRREFLAACLNQ